MKISTDNSLGRTPIRILFWTEFFHPHVGGIEKFSEELLSSLIPRGFEFIMLTSQIPHTPEQEDYRGIRIHRLPLRKGASGSLESLRESIVKIQKLKNEFKPHLSHLNTHGPSFIYHWMTRDTAPHPTLFTFHFDPPATAPESLNKILGLSSHVTAVSQDTLKKVIRTFPHIAHKSEVIYNGLPLPPPSESFSNHPFQFLCWGRLAENKGFDIALQAFAKVVKKFPEARLTLGGTGHCEQALRELRDRLGLESSVKMPGFLETERLEEEISACTAVLVPSLEQECFGLVALEAMQRGKPVLASRYGGLAEVVTDSVNGFLLPPGNADALAEAMIVLANQPRLAVSMGEKARSMAKEKFSLNSMTNQYETLYRKWAAETLTAP